MAKAGGAETIDFSKTDVYDELMALTDNRGPDSTMRWAARRPAMVHPTPPSTK